MKRILSVVAVGLFAFPLIAETKSRYIVATRRPAAKVALNVIRDIELAAAHEVRTFETLNFFAADLTESEVVALRKSPEVRYVSAVVARSISSDALKPATSSRYTRGQTIPYGIDLIGARSVWPAFQMTQKTLVNVVVLDTGIDATHPDLKARYAGGYNVFTKNNDPVDDHGHGTHVAGTIAAIDNGFGVVGVAPDVRLWSVKVLKADGWGSDETVTAGVDWVRKKKQELGGNWIMSLSLGAPQAAPAEREAFAAAIGDGILVVAAAGNRAALFLDYPSAYAGVLAITAIDKANALADFSSYGSGVAFAAPGVDVLSTARVGTEPVTDVIAERGFVAVRAFAMDASAKGEVTADVIDCGFGRPQDFPANVSGKIALISRSPKEDNFRFRDKAINAVNAGAAGLIIRNNGSVEDMVAWQLDIEGDPPFDFPVSIGVGTDDGQKLLALAGKEKVTIGFNLDDYKYLSGTSMATPHVAGSAALIWTLAPDATAEQVRIAMKMTADDLGTPNYDEMFGYGRINPLAAAKYLAPETFNVPAPPPLDPKRKRQGH